MFASVAGVARSLLRHPAFVLTAAGTLALGIAATVALFSAVNAALLKPLPYPRSEDIYSARTFFPNGRFTSGLVGSEELSALKQFQDAIADVAGALRVDGAVASGTIVRQAVGYSVSDRFFDLFGIPVAAGRAFAPDDHVPRAPRVVVLSHALWQSAFGGRGDVVGASVTVAGTPARVIGVARPEFDVPAGADLWLNGALPPTGIGHIYEGYLRLRPGVTVDAIRDRMAGAMEALGRKYPDQDVGRAYRLRPLLEVTVGDLRPILLILFSATALLLLLAAVNVTNLMLARGTARSRDIAVRAALGASRSRIVGQLVTESVLLALAGGAAGIAGAYAAVRLLMRFGGSTLPRLDAVPFDGTVIALALGVIVATGILVGIAPAFRFATSDIAALMNDTGRSVRGSRRTRRLLSAFVIAEIAVAVALVGGAARLLRSFENIQRTDPGFRAGRLITVEVVHPDRRYTDPARMTLWVDAVRSKLLAAGAARVATTSTLPMQHEWDSTSFADLASQPNVPPDKRPNGRVRFASPEFFSIMGIRVLAGRAFTDEDRTGSQPVAIVNDAFVRRFLPGADPLRERFKGFYNNLVDGKLVRRDAAIVGVVEDVHYASMTAAAEPVLYVPQHEYPGFRQSLVIEPMEGRPLSIPPLRAAILEVDSNVALEFGTMAAAVSASLSRERLGTLLMTLFGAGALVLAVVGVFGVLAYVVSQRTNEMAVRQALGATRAQLFGMVLGDGSRVTVLGIAIGLLASWWTGGLMRRYLFEVGAADPIVLFGSALVVALAAVLAVAVPARRAATLDPAQALRQT